MRKLMVMNSVTLDGVMQAPGRPDEDERGGFTHGGWAMPYNDAVRGQLMGEGMSRPTELVFGRRTYEDFYKVWPKRTNNPFTPFLDNARKYVASRTLADPLPWQNSTLLSGDAGSAIAHLKRQPGPDLLVMGSGVLIASLREHNLVDEYLLLIHPLVLGKGSRLFTEGAAFANLHLVSSVQTTTGVIAATYRPATTGAASEPAPS